MRLFTYWQNINQPEVVNQLLLMYSQARRQGGGVTEVSGNPTWRAVLNYCSMFTRCMCRTVWAQLANHTMKQLQPTLDLYYQWEVSLTTTNINLALSDGLLVCIIYTAYL